MYECMRSNWEQHLPEVDDPGFEPRAEPALSNAVNAVNAGNVVSAAIDRTPKLYVGGKQARPDSGYSYPVFDPAGKYRGEAGLGNRKDVPNAVGPEAEDAGWAQQS